MAEARPIPQSYYYSGQGRLGIGDRDPVTGIFSNVLFIGNVTELEISIEISESDHKEMMSGARSIDLTLRSETNPTVTFTAESFLPEVMAIGLHGAKFTDSGATVASESHKIKKGTAIPLKYGNVSSVVVSKAGTPITESGNYDVDSKFGTVHVLSGATGFSDGDTVTVAYTYTAQDRIEALTQLRSPERYMRFEGLNTADGSTRLIEIPRVSLQPLAAMPLIQDEGVASAEFTGKILPDLTVVASDISKYFRERRMGAA